MVTLIGFLNYEESWQTMQLIQVPGILAIKAWVPGDSGAWGSGGYGS